MKYGDRLALLFIKLQEPIMAEAATKLPVKEQEKTPARAEGRALDVLRREVERLFDRFDGDFWRTPFRRPIFDACLGVAR
jgi:hypothetical protein